MRCYGDDVSRLNDIVRQVMYAQHAGPWAARQGVCVCVCACVRACVRVCVQQAATDVEILIMLPRDGSMMSGGLDGAVQAAAHLAHCRVRHPSLGGGHSSVMVGCRTSPTPTRSPARQTAPPAPASYNCACVRARARACGGECVCVCVCVLPRSSRADLGRRELPRSCPAQNSPPRTAQPESSAQKSPPILLSSSHVHR